jgi:hypothetical protein
MTVSFSATKERSNRIQRYVDLEIGIQVFAQMRLHYGGTFSCYRHHRAADWFVAASGSSRSRGSASNAM